MIVLVAKKLSPEFSDELKTLTVQEIR